MPDVFPIFAPLPLTPNPILCRAPAQNTLSEHTAAPEADQPRLLRNPKRIDTKALLQRENAARLIEAIPQAGEVLHVICNGNFAAWDMIPAIRKLTGQRITRLDVATLGFSKSNVAQMRAMLDAGQIGELWLIYSCYFRSTSKVETEFLHETLTGPKVRIASFRTHAKLLIVELSGGDCLTIETSANLRSCKNIEQYAITNDRPLMEFHRRWIEDAIKDVETNGQKK